MKQKEEIVEQSALGWLVFISSYFFSISPALELTEQEKVEAEMARLAKTLKRGGHSI